MQAEHGLNWAELLYQLLSMAGNLGDIPDLLIDLLYFFFLRETY
jgi:hypothetical protein